MKLHIKFRTGLAGDRYSYRRGERRWIDKREAESLVRAGIAELVQEAEAMEAELVSLREQVATGQNAEADALASDLATARADLAAALVDVAERGPVAATPIAARPDPATLG